MLEGFLRFPVVVEAEFVHGSVADGPGVADVPLLEPFAGNRSETRHVGAGGLKLRKGRDYVVIVEIVIKAKVLLVVDPVVKLYCELIATVRLYGYSLNDVGSRPRSGNVLKEFDGSSVQALQRDLVGRKDVGVVCAVLNYASTDVGHRL